MSRVLVGAQVVLRFAVAVVTRFRAPFTASSETGSTTDLTTPFNRSRALVFSWRDTCEAPRLFLTTLAPAMGVKITVTDNTDQTTGRTPPWADGTQESPLWVAQVIC